MSFRRTAISLISIVVVTAVLAGIYLYFNFNSRSNLITIVPKDANWYYHFQTREIKSKVSGTQPPFFDSFSKCISKLPVFKNVKDPGEVGIALFSDLVVFSNQYGWYAALSVNSEPRLTEFVTKKISRNYIGGIIPNADCNFVKANNHPIYFAWKHKACLIFVPNDTIENLQRTEKALAVVFKEEKHSSIAELPVVQQLYDKESDVVFYSAGEFENMTHGVSLKDKNAAFVFSSGTEKSKVSPLWLFSKTGAAGSEKDVDLYLNKVNSISTYQYLNLTFKSLYLYLKPFTK